MVPLAAIAQCYCSKTFTQSFAWFRIVNVEIIYSEKISIIFLKTCYLLDETLF